jgi:hypothetical protein
MVIVSRYWPVLSGVECEKGSVNGFTVLQRSLTRFLESRIVFGLSCHTAQIARQFPVVQERCDDRPNRDDQKSRDRVCRDVDALVPEL